MTHDLDHWRELMLRHRFKKLNGWHFGTLWVDGTPAALIADKMRIGHGLIEKEEV
jgi:hypothetical protein